MQVINLEQGSDAWLNFRKNHIGASEAATILGINPWETAYQLWQRKLGLLEAAKTTEAMTRGTELESAAREKFEAMTGISAKPIVLQHENIHYMMASLDGFDDHEKVVIEFKCPGIKTHMMAAEKIIPEYYLTQINHQLEVANVDHAYYVTYFEGDINIVPVCRDDDLIKNIIESQADFYRRMIEFDAPLQKHRNVESLEMQNAVEHYRKSVFMLKIDEKTVEDAKKKILEISGDECIQGFGLKVTHYHEKGRVDYSAIKELENIDLDKYRKPPAFKSRISFT